MSSLFGNTGFGAPTQQTSNPFASASPPKSNVFGSLNIGAATSQVQQPSNPFASATTTGSQPSGGLFGTALPQQQATGGGLFGSSAQPAQSGHQPQKPSLLGNLGLNFGVNTNTQTQQQPQQQGGPFGGLGQGAQQQPQQQGSLFGQASQQQQQQPQQLQLGGLSQSKIWSDQEIPQRQKSIADQIELVFAKWNPESRNSYFQTYLYNNAGDNAPFLRPDPTDDEEKWEEALQKRPYPEAIPTPVKGFGALGQRIIIATDHLNFVHGRIAEINKGLTHLLQKHDLEVSVRVEECQRRHLRISQKCLALATKTQVLRNRGYAMDGAEEQLRQKLLTLEKNVMDPALVGRSEEIWARMVSVRERGRQLQFEFEKAGKTLQENHTQAIDPETLKTVKKILEDYDSQLAHLARELEQIKTEFEEWEQTNSAANGYARGR